MRLTLPEIKKKISKLIPEGIVFEVTLEAGSYWGELYDWNNIAVEDDAENVITGEFCQTFGIESQ